MAEAVILPAIENLDSWLADLGEVNYEKLRLLFEKADLCTPLVGMSDFCGDNREELYSWLIGMADFGEDNKEKLYSFIVRMTDFGEYNKEKLHSLVVGMADFGEELHSLLADFWEDKKKNLYILLFGIAGLRRSKKQLNSFLVGMAGFEEPDKEKLYSLVIGMADLWKDSREKMCSLLVGVADPWKDSDGRVNKRKLKSLLVEMADLWDDDDKGKLHSLLVELAELWGHDINVEGKLCSLLVEMAGIWKHDKVKLNKEKLHSWLANKADLWESKQLFLLLLHTALLEKDIDKGFLRSQFEGITCFNQSARPTVELTKNDLRWILGFLTDKKLEEEEGSCRLHYFISDVVEMAREAHLLIQVMDSDPFILFLEIFHRQEHLDSRNPTSKVLLREIKSIQCGLQETKEGMLELGVERSENVGELEGGEDVVGLEEDIRLLLYNKNIRTITFIRGMGGIGKTTLARELYNHPDVVDGFECRAWVSLSGELSRKEVLIKLIRQVVDSKEFERDDESSLEKMDNKSLKQMLHQQLQSMRYFIVLDDVSESTLFKYVLQALLQAEEKGSRLLFTTRSVDIKCNYREDYNHKVKFLDEDKSWQLLLKTVFFRTSGQELPKYLEKKGKEMLRKCNGLPLAIKEVGRKWAIKRRSGNQWDEVVESMDLGETLVALESTYHHLESEVKTCFLHLAFFKEGTTIRAQKLVQILKTGVVSKIEDNSRHYLSKLVNESIIEAKTQTKYDIKTCRINPVFHKLSITKAVDEISFEILRIDGNNRRSKEPRHRVIYCSREEFDYSRNEDKHLLSLFFHGGGYFNATPSYWKQFELLKILDMEDFGLKILPEAVGTLIELKYLGLRNNYIQELPHSLCHLKKLEVLDIALNFMMEVPDIIWEMDSLRHLSMSDMSCKKPLKIDALKNLETLTYISIDSWTFELSGLKMMTELYKLGIEEVDGNSDVRKLFTSLAELENLDCLILRGFRFRSMPSLDEIGILQGLTKLKLDGLLTRLPSVNNFPPKVWYLSLVNSCLDHDPMPILEKLSELRYLKLQNAYSGQQMVISPHGFPSLRCLIIGELWHLRNIQVGKGALFWVSGLEINSCPYLEALPEEIELMAKLRKLKMNTTKSNASKIWEYSGFICRIPEVDIQP